MKITFLPLFKCMNLPVFHGAASADLSDPLRPLFSIVTKTVHMRLPTRPKEDEVRQGSRVEQKEAVDSQQQSTEETSEQQSAGESSRQKSMEADGRERRLLGYVDSEAGLANVRG